MSDFIVGIDILGECVFYKGAISADYGHVRDGKKVLTAHRLACKIIKGIIPLGMEIHHVCRHRLCINPNHLIAMTPQAHRVLENKVRIGFDNDLNTHCPQGHLLDGENKKQRFCRTCKKLILQAIFGKKKFRKKVHIIKNI